MHVKLRNPALKLIFSILMCTFQPRSHQLFIFVYAMFILFITYYETKTLINTRTATTNISHSSRSCYVHIYTPPNVEEVVGDVKT